MGSFWFHFQGSSTLLLVVIYATIMLISKLYVLYYCCSCDLSKKRGFTVLSCWILICSIRLTYQKISENMLKMKVIQNFVLINIYIIHFIDKVCWTSQILEENSWKKCDMFLLWVLVQATKTRRWRPVHQNKQQNVIFFFKNFFKDLWSSANFVNDFMLLNVIQNWKMENFH